MVLGEEGFDALVAVSGGDDLVFEVLEGDLGRGRCGGVRGICLYRCARSLLGSGFPNIAPSFGKIGTRQVAAAEYLNNILLIEFVQ